VLWVRRSVDEPESWREAGASHRRMGSFRDLFGDRRWARSALLGLALAAVGMGTFWGITVAGQDLAYDFLVRHGMSPAEAAQKSKFAYGIVQTAGGGLGLLSFGPLAERFGRRPAFVIMHVGALAVVPALCYGPATYPQMLAMLPVFGFFTLGSHAGYAVYFPELFPAHLRATGSGVCFNGGRLLAAPMLLVSAQVKSLPGLDLRRAVCVMSLLFVVGLFVLLFLPETKGRPLPESE
jgi:MFS family permease